METTAVAVCLDHVAICNQAIGTLGRRGVFRWVEREELMSVGCLAVLKSAPDKLLGITQAGAEALAVITARRAMIDAIRRNEVRQRGRQDLAPRDGETAPGESWDALLYSRQKLVPAGREIDLWEALKALPARQYRVIMMHFWGNATQAQIGDELGISQPAVVKILNAAKKSLREVINGDLRAMNQIEGEMRPNSLA
jgi:RNA polymerase sigma factor (sigma-70 family)